MDFLFIGCVAVLCFAIGYGIGWDRAHNMWRRASYQQAREHWRTVYERQP